MKIENAVPQGAAFFNQPDYCTQLMVQRAKFSTGTNS